MDFKKAIEDITSYINNEFGDNAVFVIYGSFIEAKEGFFVEPKDVDIALLNFYNLSETIHVKIPELNIPLEITPMYSSEIVRELDALEPKYFNFYSSDFGHHSMIYDELDNKKIGKYVVILVRFLLRLIIKARRS
jgi:hypothetical protein